MSKDASKQEQIKTVGITHKKPNRYVHEVKGPEVLTPSQIKDIIESRPLPFARKKMSDKYGISVVRVNNIWKQYYGGGTLKDYETGLKVPLPTEAIKTADITMRKFRTERGTYMAKDPKIINENPAAIATAVRRLKPSRKIVNKDLDLDNTDAMGDNEAEILAGEVSAGNNSSELLEAVYELLEHNQHISDRAISALENALKAVSKRQSRAQRRNAGSYSEYSESDYDASNIGDTEDDSTITYKTQTPGRGVANIPQNILEGDNGRGINSVESRGPMDVYEGATNRLAGHNQMGEACRKGTPGSDPRAQPLYTRVGVGGQQYTSPEQVNSGETIGLKSALPPIEHNSSQGGLQSNSAHNYPQCYPWTRTGVGLHSGGGDRSGETVQGIPWLKRRTG